MFVPFLYELRSRGVPVGTQEALNLARALTAGLHDSSLEGFYDVAKALLVHDEKHLDDFDQAFLKHFRGVEVESRKLKDELLEWLQDAKHRVRELTPEERALLERFDPEELKRLFDERMNEQTERHDRGNRWIGTGGTSPFGHSGAKRPGIRVGGAG
ncbi:MAG TPA: VWA containing CoxE family protein, partial [Sandaracinaceae bacterium LLY-WYZ-13_1]|nr:VWA containing CoxE family protein [Sandaracinaceae bacterium LLY-WYZ-13_1]